MKSLTAVCCFIVTVSIITPTESVMCMCAPGKKLCGSDGNIYYGQCDLRCQKLNNPDLAGVYIVREGDCASNQYPLLPPEPYRPDLPPPAYEPNPPGYGPNQYSPGRPNYPPGYVQNQYPPRYRPNLYPPGYGPNQIPPGYGPDQLPPGYGPEPGLMRSLTIAKTGDSEYI